MQIYIVLLFSNFLPPKALKLICTEAKLVALLGRTPDFVLCFCRYNPGDVVSAQYILSD